MVTTRAVAQRRGRGTRRGLHEATMLCGALAVPGLAAWRGGQRRLARITLAAALVATAVTVTVVIVAGGPVGAISSPWALPVIAAANLGLLGVRLFELRRAIPTTPPRSPGPARSRAERARARRRRRRSSVMRRSLAVLAAAIVVAPHTALAAELELTRRAVNDAFVPAGEDAAAAEDVRDPAEIPAAGHSPVKDPTTSTSDPAPPEPPAQNRVDILLVGLDAGVGREGARNDANLVVSIDRVTAEATLIGVPRNMVRLPDPRSEDPCGCFRSPLYALYQHGLDHPEHHPPDEADPGAAAVREVLGALLQRSIDHYVVMDMAAFYQVVDGLGGVTVQLPEEVRYVTSHPTDADARMKIDLGPGTHHLDGANALALVRTRRGADDYRRMERQRCLVTGSLEPVQRLGPWQVWLLVGEVRGQLHTDVPRADIPELFGLARRVQPDAVHSLGLVPPRFVASRIDGHPVPDLEAIRAALDEPSPELAADGC